MTASKEPTHQDWAKRFHVACGNCYHLRDFSVSNNIDGVMHYKCTKCQQWVPLSYEWRPEPTFLNPADILDEVMKWDDADEFVYRIGCDCLHQIVKSTEAGILDQEIIVRGINVVVIDLITERPPTRLLKEATLFKEGKK
jgi:hypothetical protein